MHKDEGAGHQGADKAKGADRTKRQRRVRRWVPGMDRAEERRVSTSQACQGGVESGARDTRNPTKTPEELWPRRDKDHRGLTQGGHHIIGVSNGHTRYPEEAEVKGTRARDNSQDIVEVYSRHGGTKRHHSNNGGAGNGKDRHRLQRHLANRGSKHVKNKSA